MRQDAREADSPGGGPDDDRSATARGRPAGPSSVRETRLIRNVVDNVGELRAVVEAGSDDQGGDGGDDSDDVGVRGAGWRGVCAE